MASNPKMDPVRLSLKLPFHRLRVFDIKSSFRSMFQYLSSLYSLIYSLVAMQRTFTIPSSFCIDMFFIAVTE